MLILFLAVFILPQVLATVQLSPREPNSMSDFKIKNEQIVDEAAVKETQILEPKSKTVVSSISQYYGLSGSFVHGFIATLAVIIVSELGDKTFFIAAIMAMRHPRLTILSGAISALSIIHVMSALFGALALIVIPKALDYDSALDYSLVQANVHLVFRFGWIL